MAGESTNELPRFTERLIMELGGPEVFREARSIRDAGRVQEVEIDGRVVRGLVGVAEQARRAGLTFGISGEVENLCQCRASREEGRICAHSLALIFQCLRRVEPRHEAIGTPSVSPPVRAVAPPRALWAESLVPGVRLLLEGSLRHVEAEVSLAGGDLREGEVFASLLQMGFVDYRGRPALRGEAKVLEFLEDQVPVIERSWEVKFGERLSHVLRGHVRVTPHFRVRDDGDGWLHFQVHYSAGPVILGQSELERLIAGGSRDLSGGRKMLAPRAQVLDMQEVLNDCDPQQERGGYRIRTQHRNYLLKSIEDWAPDQNPAPAKSTVQLGPIANRLRPYQRDGAEWLVRKAREKSGGMLADEMGLGKTIQALALVEVLDGPVLVVCPSSLVWNWLREAGRFVPDLPALGLTGPGRAEQFRRIRESRLVVTSYALLRRDLKSYEAIPFAAVILDEAQHIKNPDSQNAQAASSLRAGARFILTGTPVENGLRDLWSLFHFLHPGMLGSREEFEARYVRPLLEVADPLVWRRLLRRISPFMLRRTKAGILTELPPKIEQVVPVEMSEEEKRAYGGLQKAARDAIHDARGNSSSRVKVLTALLRLRQACCDLRLLGAPESTPRSSKRAALLEILGEAVDGRHRVLVFSQFTSVLDLIGEDLSAEGLRFCRLDGSTRDRQRVVGEFENDPDIPVFLISLKAGGTGLNLTSADTVVHFDPWWNPAVEAQATDRAHRIGQRRVVTSLKLVCRDSVEERVLALQEKKKELIGGVLDPESVLGSLTDRELEELVTPSTREN